MEEYGRGGSTHKGSIHKSLQYQKPLQWHIKWGLGRASHTHTQQLEHSALCWSTTPGNCSEKDHTRERRKDEVRDEREKKGEDGEKGLLTLG